MERRISVVIPNYNMADTIGLCLEAALSSAYRNYEVIVVDDCSDDNSLEIVSRYPCKLVRLDKRSGTSRARNEGAAISDGELIFFIDADCILQKDTLAIVNETISCIGTDVVLGGTYTEVPFDRSFFSMFQSVFVNYSETKSAKSPDYIAAHAMVMSAETFRGSGGFPEDFLPIIEDVEFSHRLRRSGLKLTMNGEIQVKHIFNFSLWKSLSNAFRKTTYWNIYSLMNRDVFKDSGSASVELKTNVVSFFMSAIVAAIAIVSRNMSFLFLLPVLMAINIFISKRLIGSFYRAGGAGFGGLAAIYYLLLYPVPVGFGTFNGLLKYLAGSRK